MSLAVTSSIVWWTRRPLIAANIARIILGSSAFSCRSKGGRGGSGDHGAVDVREHLLAHVLAVDCGDDGAIRNGDDERRVVDEHEGGAGALCRGAVDTAGEPVHCSVVERDAAAFDPR